VELEDNVSWLLKSGNLSGSNLDWSAVGIAEIFTDDG
jgi:hypothetical protein